jgi:outer membrane protein
MNFNLKFTCLVLIGLFITMPAYADELLSVKVGAQLLSPQGSVGGTINSVGGTVDIDSDLGLDDSVEFSGEIAFNLGNSRLSLNLLPMGFSGGGRLSEAVVIDDVTFAEDVAVQTDLNIDLYDIGYTYYFVNIDDMPTRLQLGLEAAVKIADTEFKLTSDGASESVSAIVPIPTVGGRARIALADFLGLTGRIGYMEYSGNHFMDAEAQIEYSPLPLIGIYVGVRYFDLKIDEEDIYIDTQLSGPYGGLMVRF